MNDSNFDQFLKQKMDQERSFVFSDDKWDRMERQLDYYHSRKRDQRLLWVLGFSLLCALGASYFIYDQLTFTKNRINELGQQINELSMAKSSSLESSNSKVSELAVLHDTIYKYIYINHDNSTISNNDRLSNLKNSRTNQLNDKNADSKTSITNADQRELVNTSELPSDHNKLNNKNGNESADNPSSTLKSKESSTENSKSNYNDSNQHKPNETSIESQPSSRINKDQSKDSISIKSETPTLPSITNTKQSFLGRMKLKERVKPIIAAINPSTYEFGVISGAAFINDDDIVDQSGYTIGARASIYYYERFRLTCDAQFISLIYNVENLQSRNDYPIISPPTSNDVFEELVVRKPSVRLGIGAQYLLSTSQWQPYLGAAFHSGFGLKDSYVFNFKNKLTGKPTSVLPPRVKSKIEFPNLQLNLGISYPIINNWKVGIEGSYDFPLEDWRKNKGILQAKGLISYRF